MNAPKRSILRSQRGQSTVELALMMPIVFTVFFWMFESNILMSGMHMTAYGAYVGARAHLVENQDNGVRERSAVRRVLTGGIFRQNYFMGGRSPLFQVYATNRGSMIGPGTAPSHTASSDGVVVTVPMFASLPYVRHLFNLDASGNPRAPLGIPTHLGPDEWTGNSDQRWGLGTGCQLTDNNLTDDC